MVLCISSRTIRAYLNILQFMLLRGLNRAMNKGLFFEEITEGFPECQQRNSLLVVGGFYGCERHFRMCSPKVNCTLNCTSANCMAYLCIYMSFEIRTFRNF